MTDGWPRDPNISSYSQSKQQRYYAQQCLNKLDDDIDKFVEIDQEHFWKLVAVRSQIVERALN